MSTIKLLKEFLEKNYKTTKIEALNDHRIGVEAIPWIFKLPIKDPFQITMGGLPLTLVDILDKELDKLKKVNIKPFFVFNGLSIIKERINNNLSQMRSNRINSAWDLYYRGDQYIQAEKSFLEATEKGFYGPFIHYIISYFKQNNIEFFKAPYFAGPQLAYFSDPTQKSYLNAVFGSPELLLFGVNRLIIDIDYEKGTYVWVDLKTILQELGLSHDQFIDACLLCGFEYVTPFPMFPQNYDFKTICEIVKSNHSGIDTIRNYLMSGVPGLDKYMDQFLKTKTLIQNHLIYYSSCVCEPIKEIQYPNKILDVNQIFGVRLPNDVYFYISQGVISQQVINNFVSGILVEPYPPLESEEFRTLLDYLKNLRSKTIGLLSSCLNHELKSKNVKNIRWFEPKEIDMYLMANSFEFINNLPKKLSDQVKNLIKSAKSTNNQPITFQFIAKSLTDSGSNTNTNGSTTPTNNDGASTAIRDMDEALYLSFQHTMSIMGYTNPSAQHLTIYSEHFQSIQNPKLQEPVILFIELLRAGVITSEKLNFIPKPTFTGIPAKPSALLLSRILSLVPVQCDTNPWGGPVDNDLMGFHEIARSLYRSIRNLLELASLANFLTFKIILQPNEYFNYSLKLPFFLQPSAAMGLLVKGILLDNLTFDSLEKIFPNFINLKNDLNLADEFWSIVMKIVNDLNKVGSSEVNTNLLKTFKEADEAWKSSRKLMTQ